MNHSLLRHISKHLSKIPLCNLTRENILSDSLFNNPRGFFNTFHLVDYPFISGAVGEDYTLKRGSDVADFLKNFAAEEENGEEEPDIQVPAESGLITDELEA